MIELTFKTADVLDQLEDLTEEELSFVEEFVRHGEYITVRFDPSSKTTWALAQ